MLPYPNSLHIISQEPPSPNPTFLIPPASLVHDYDFLLPGDRFGSETLEAVVGPLAVAPDGPVVHPLSEPRKGAAMGGRVAARKRPLRTDRHSKIRTALGVRDRRMRLSVDVARDFFALQDRLGFDKASKTVGWLLTQSKPAIDLLSGPLNHGGGADTSTSSSPVVLGSKESAVDAVSANKSTDVTESTIESTSDGPKLMEQSCELDWVSSAAFDQPMAWDSGAMDGLSYYY